MRKKLLISLGFIVCLWPAAARADMIWPALVLEMRLLSLPAIAAGLLVEWLFYKFGLRLGWKKSATVNLAINGTSAFAGILAIPIAGLLWELVPAIVRANTFNPISWVCTYLIAVAITTSVEILAARRFFGLVETDKDKLVVLAANAASVGIAFASLFAYSPSLN